MYPQEEQLSKTFKQKGLHMSSYKETVGFWLPKKANQKIVNKAIEVSIWPLRRFKEGFLVQSYKGLVIYLRPGVLAATVIQRDRHIKHNPRPSLITNQIAAFPEINKTPPSEHPHPSSTWRIRSCRWSSWVNCTAEVNSQGDSSHSYLQWSCCR